MLVGYNTNVPYKGNLYHVQTEDSGLKNPIITTLLYFKGTILSSKKVNYAHIASSPDYKEKVRELMKEQHKAMMKELINGKHTGDAPASDRESTPEAVDTAPAALTPTPPAPEPAPEPAPAAAEPRERKKEQITRSLDDILLDFIINEGEKGE